ncbi:MAG: DJ-1/PfpI family protein, partial [Acidobacteriota bacterium]
MSESTSSGATPSSADPSSTAPPTLRVGVVLFPGFEALDVYGPVEMWGNVPELTITTMAEAAGPVPSSQGPSTVAEVSFAEAPQFDILMVPGGFGTRREMENGVLLEFLRRQHGGARLTTSVCTGSVLLA